MLSNHNAAQRKRENDGHHFAGKQDEIYRSKVHCDKLHDASIASLKETVHLVQDDVMEP